jgi:hypothetical protein
MNDPQIRMQDRMVSNCVSHWYPLRQILVPDENRKEVCFLAGKLCPLINNQSRISDSGDCET